ncbi:MAG: ABC transporter ATP-binding protein [Nitrospirae bacterium GWC2_57_13]|nr:MAG: ABC transporter ATP-binding protein [Nitrospirae bacterium GWC2_57_13]OGW41895.1 MAG: ABC transporter ATP-binding protein [Nitrospirae bacterium GWD2_57_8]HAR46976.1 ABC transporter ATP-binding protein [Nitrospiraceae bacterium]HAS54880.1 ABC transporter ATP-binding protein [Nitrospiraceae bacterium]
MIEIQNVHKSFGSHHVLRGANLTVEKGESMTVIGGSGSGKSVLLKHIIGLLFPDKGKVVIDGQEISSLKGEGLNEMRKKFGMLFQLAALFDSLTVWENVGFALKQHTKMSDEEVRVIATEKLELVGLKGVEDKMPADLSGGMKKRVGLARAIAMEPGIILYDEPTTGLDPIMADAINDLIIDLRKKLGVTSVAITHDMQSAYKISDRIAMLYKGEILETGTPDEIRNTENPIVRQFITGSAVGPITAE